MTNEQIYWSANNRNNKRKHKGTFSSNNPFLQQLEKTTNKKDEDWLYSLAVDWEADNANYELQKRDAAELRAEEREYNDPTNEIARQRAAGINPDLAGVSASGGSSGGSSVGLPTMADQSTQLKPNNAYDNQAMAIQGVSAAASLISAVGSFGTSLVGGFQALKLLPSALKSADAAANVAEATQDDAINLSHQAVKDGSLKNARESLSFVNDLSSLISPEATDEEIDALLATSGISSDMLPNYRSSIRQAHKNPNFGAYFADAEKRKRATEAFNAEYTSEVLAQSAHTARLIESAEQSFALSSANFKNTLAKLFMTDENAQLISDSYVSDYKANISSNNATISANNLSIAQDKFAYAQLEHDAGIFVQSLENCKSEMVNIDAYIDKIFSDANKTELHELTAYDQAIVTSLRLRKMMISNLASDQLDQLYNHCFRASQTMFFSQNPMTMSDGKVKIQFAPNILNNFSRFTFGEFYSGDVSSVDLVKSIIDNAPKPSPTKAIGKIIK